MHNNPKNLSTTNVGENDTVFMKIHPSISIYEDSLDTVSHHANNIIN